ncbi:DUF397 domain-containing protein [Streptomyces sp. x-80]|uniref:DUF397 domain-containing protein n=1 Tax=Streptomyces sp. x-80 TaxID=2789282 RepID=UPI00397F36C1
MGEIPNWRTSTYTKPDSCVEVSDNDPAKVMVRDTKARQYGTMTVQPPPPGRIRGVQQEHRDRERIAEICIRMNEQAHRCGAMPDAYIAGGRAPADGSERTRVGQPWRLSSCGSFSAIAQRLRREPPWEPGAGTAPAGGCVPTASGGCRWPSSW